MVVYPLLNILNLDFVRSGSWKITTYREIPREEKMGQVSYEELKAGREKKVEEYVRLWPERYRKRGLEVLSGKCMSLKKIIRVMCEDCCCHEELEKQVGECCVIKCPLWSYRPYRKDIPKQPKKILSEEELKIARDRLAKNLGRVPTEIEIEDEEGDDRVTE